MHLQSFNKDNYPHPSWKYFLARQGWRIQINYILFLHILFVRHMFVYPTDNEQIWTEHGKKGTRHLDRTTDGEILNQ